MEQRMVDKIMYEAIKELSSLEGALGGEDLSELIRLVGNLKIVRFKLVEARTAVNIAEQAILSFVGGRTLTQDECTHPKSLIRTDVNVCILCGKVL